MCRQRSSTSTARSSRTRGGVSGRCSTTTRARPRWLPSCTRVCTCGRSTSTTPTASHSNLLVGLWNSARPTSRPSPRPPLTAGCRPPRAGGTHSRRTPNGSERRTYVMRDCIFSDDVIAKLSPAERRDLINRLERPLEELLPAPTLKRVRLFRLVVTFGAVVGLIPWIVYLGLTLPG